MIVDLIPVLNVFFEKLSQKFQKLRLLCKLPNQLTELEIIKGCLKKNTEAQKSLYLMHGSYLMGLAIRYTGNREDAEEIFHDTLMKIYSSIDKYKFESSFKTWISRICINTSIDFIRKNKNAMMVEHISEKVLGITDTDLENEVSMEAELAMKLLNQLPMNQKLIINLFLIDDFSHKEIAAKLQISEEASRTQYSRAKKHLAELVKLKLQKNEQQR